MLNKSTKKQLSTGIAVLVMAAAILMNSSAETNYAAQHSPATNHCSAETINVVLTEWTISPDKTTVSAGPVTFKVINSGSADVNEMAVVKTDLAAASLPVDANGNMDEKAKGIRIIGEIEDIAVGASTHAAFDLEPGNYVLICNIWDSGEQESHYAEGMFIAFKVR